MRDLREGLADARDGRVFWITRRGDYRALYSIDDRKRAITVLAVAHRRGTYRPR